MTDTLLSDRVSTAGYGNCIGGLYFLWHRHQIEGTNGFTVSRPMVKDNGGKRIVPNLSCEASQIETDIF